VQNKEYRACYSTHSLISYITKRDIPSTFDTLFSKACVAFETSERSTFDS